MTVLPILSTLHARPVAAKAQVAPSTGEPGAPPEFDALLDRLDRGGTANVTGTPPSTLRPLVAHEARKVPPLEQFEGFVLRSFVESMLPTEASSFFGKGTAGEIWRSMLAEHIGDELARDGGIGIADAIAGRQRAAEGRRPGETVDSEARQALRQIKIAPAGSDASAITK